MEKNECCPICGKDNFKIESSIRTCRNCGQTWRRKKYLGESIQSGNILPNDNEFRKQLEGLIAVRRQMGIKLIGDENS